MRVGILGLGLIGGSLAKAYAAAGHEVLACDSDEAVLAAAALADIIDGTLDEETIGSCELLLLAVYPQGVIEFMQKNAPHIAPGATIIDCCGIKRTVCDALFPLARRYGFCYVGGHPMAGTHHSGLAFADPELFRGAPMVLVPPVYDDIFLLDRVKKLLEPAGFGRFTVTTAEAHDRMIAFTSQLAHVVSNAYVKSPSARQHEGFSAGSYKDLTRVAWLNAAMWADLFLNNRDFLTQEIDSLIRELGKYRDALTENDAASLYALLEEGRLRKEEIDGP